MKKISSSSKIQRLLKQANEYCQCGRFLEAKNIYQDLLEFIPSHPEVLGNIGIIELQEGNTENGVDYLKKSINKDPGNSIYLSNIANGLLDLNRPDEALLYYNSALKITPTSSNLFYNMARANKALNKINEAISNYKEAIRLNNKNVLAYLNLGFLFNAIEEYELALNEYSSGIKIDPSNYQLFYNRGIAFENLKKYELALEDYKKAVQLNKNFEPALFNKCDVLIKMGLIQEARDIIEGLIKINPNNSEYFIKLGTIFEDLKDFDKAIINYDYALKLNPEAFHALTMKSFIKLSHNFFREGWLLYEGRWKNSRVNRYLKTSNPELKSFNITGKTIFIWAEQGIGDQIIYSSLLHDAFKSKNQFYISIDPRLISVFRRSFSWADHVKFISSKEGLLESKYDFHLPLGSLGKFFRNSIEDFKTHPEGYLKVKDSEACNLRNIIKKNHRKICGISWLSKNNELGDNKSLSLLQLLPILSLPEITFVNLQYGNTQEEVKNILDMYEIEIQSINQIDNFNDLDGLSSLINACDYIVTTSNVTAHIAGALNKKTFLLVPYSQGKIWYWGENECKSLWYPSVTIYRCDKLNFWNKAIQKLSEDLKKYD